MPDAVINIAVNSPDWRGQALSNFGLSPFIFDGVLLASVEGFIQGIKFPPGDARRAQAFAASGWEAKHFGDAAERRQVWWREAALDYGSAGHHAWIVEAIRTRVLQSPGLQAALCETAPAPLVHDTGKPDAPTTSLPTPVFLQALHALRAELLEAPRAFG